MTCPVCICPVCVVGVFLATGMAEHDALRDYVVAMLVSMGRYVREERGGLW